MLFFYLRHGDPIYNPDSLTELGIEQAEALSKRLAAYGLDKVYTSTSNRAIMTARPTCEKLGLEPETVDFANEGHAWKELTINEDGKFDWLFQHPNAKDYFCNEEIIKLGHKWYEHPYFKDYDYKKGIDRIVTECDAFFKRLGYERIPGTGKYKVIKSNDQRVALFAHQGFGMAFLSYVLDIPYPIFSVHFDMGPSDMTVINFKEVDGYAVPKILTLSNDAHLYKEGLFPNYNGYAEF